MVNFFNIYFIFFFLTVCSCSQGKVLSSNTYPDSGSRENIQVSGEFNPLPKEHILVDGKADEFEPIWNLIFQGFPGSRQEKPLIPIKSQEHFEKSDAYKYIKQNAKRFVNDEHSTANQIAINLHLLRQYLENEKIIKPFGL